MNTSNILPGGLAQSGADPVQAAITVSHSLDDLLKDRKQTSGSSLGGSVMPNSVALYWGEIAVVDLHCQGHATMPPVFSSLTGIDVRKERGQEEFNRRFGFAGIVVTERTFNSASGLFNPKVTLQIHGTSPMRWRSPFAYNPIPGDLVVKYAPSLDDATRALELDQVVNNSSGHRYAAEIHTDNRIPFLVKRFGIEDILHLPQRSVHLFATNPEKYAQMILNRNPDRSIALSPELECMLDILAAPVKMLAITKVGGMSVKEAISAFVLTTAEFAVTPVAEEVLRGLAPNADVEAAKNLSRNTMTHMFNAMFQIVKYAQSSIVGRVARGRLGDFVTILLS